MRKLGMRYEPGWVGAFTRQQAVGAIPNGSRVRRAGFREPGDSTPDGTAGTVLGSLYVPEKGYAYFVEFEDRPKCAVLVIERKIKED